MCLWGNVLVFSGMCLLCREMCCLSLERARCLGNVLVAGRKSAGGFGRAPNSAGRNVLTVWLGRRQAVIAGGRVEGELHPALAHDCSRTGGGAGEGTAAHPAVVGGCGVVHGQVIGPPGGIWSATGPPDHGDDPLGPAAWAGRPRPTAPFHFPGRRAFAGCPDDSRPRPRVSRWRRARARAGIVGTEM